jgi:hypothetical protein
VLSLGPHGIQPYVRISRNARGLGLDRLVALVGALAWGLTASARWAASGLASRPMSLTTVPRAQG